MRKYYVVGDLHLHDINPRSRVDDYSSAILTKLSYMFNLAKKDNIEAIFFLGDIFHKPSGLSTKYLNKVIDVFQSSPCPCYTIIGNHDIPFNRIEDVDNTSLGILFKSQALTPLAEHPYYVTSSIVIYGYNYNTDISSIECPDQISYGICLSHSYGEDVSFGQPGKAEYFKWSLPNNKPFNLYVLGHDHSYYETKHIYQSSELIRLGALSRVTSAISDTQRDISILQLNIDPDNIVITKDRVKIPCTSSLECFSQQSLDKGFNKIDLNRSLEDILLNLDFSIQSSIFDVIDSMDLPSDVLNILESYLKNNFITRKESLDNEKIIHSNNSC